MKDAPTSVELGHANTVGIYIATDLAVCCEAMNYL